jgi:4-diphosphocytidyl-2-C-methyl-D-erythritol kinase
MPGRIAIEAPAKINLALHVTGRRADGYHEIETLVVFAGPGDMVTVEPSDADRFAIDGPRAAALAASGDNLVTRARDRLRAAFRRETERPVSILLTKALPIASGIGGGSSDAAAALRALARFWQLDAGPGVLDEIGLALGADVPMCLAGRPLVASGIGERLAAIDGFPVLHLVLVNPGVAVATPEVFGRLERTDNPPLPPLPRTIDAPGLAEWLRETRNDLQAPATRLAPAIDEALQLIDDAGSTFSRMSGSGATCFGLFRDAPAASAAEMAIRERRPEWYVAAMTQTAGKG